MGMWKLEFVKAAQLKLESKKWQSLGKYFFLYIEYCISSATCLFIQTIIFNKMFSYFIIYLIIFIVIFTDFFYILKLSTLKIKVVLNFQSVVLSAKYKFFQKIKG